MMSEEDLRSVKCKIWQTCDEIPVTLATTC